MTGINLLDDMLENIVRHSGYNVEFAKFYREDKLRVLSACIKDVRFDTYELFCESGLYIERIAANLASEEFDEMEAGRAIFNALILAVTDKVQEIIEELSEDIRLSTPANDEKRMQQEYEDEIERAIFGGAK